jgi:2,4-dienoyl-CoA reductase-like NADH-dependent reductase (Old Yellow Enzyme family)
MQMKGTDFMEAHRKFKFSSIGDLQQKLEKVGIDLPLAEDTSVLKQPLSLEKNIIPNRMVIHPMEGCDGDGEGHPGELTRRRYRRFASGGAGLLWFEATAVVAEGRANPRQLLITKKTAKSLALLLQEALTAAANKNGSDRKPYTVVQLTHSGRYSRPVSKPQPIIAATNPYLDDKNPAPKIVITDAQLEELEDRYAEAAVLAAEIGFNAVDIKSCHRYLISELLSAHTREGAYGGSFENRTRFLFNIIEKIQKKVPAEIDIAVRLNAFDAIPHPYGWGVDRQNHRQVDLSEPIRLVQQLQDRGVKLMNISAGNPYYNPHICRPYDTGPYVPQENQLYAVERMLKIACAIQKAAPQAAIVATGLSWLREFAAAVAAGGVTQGWFQLAGFGRQSLAYPDFAQDIINTGKMERKKCCIACGKCVELMRLDGVTGCVMKDAEVYRPIYQKLKQGKPSLVGKEVADHV